MRDKWFVSTDGTETDGNTIRVTEMTNYPGNTPNFEYTSLPVTPSRKAPQADQPGGYITTFPNDDHASPLSPRAPGLNHAYPVDTQEHQIW
jgi:hypothetical protein